MVNNTYNIIHRIEIYSVHSVDHPSNKRSTKMAKDVSQQTLRE